MVVGVVVVAFVVVVRIIVVIMAVVVVIIIVAVIVVMLGTGGGQQISELGGIQDVLITGLRHGFIDGRLELLQVHDQIRFPDRSDLRRLELKAMRLLARLGKSGHRRMITDDLLSRVLQPVKCDDDVRLFAVVASFGSSGRRAGRERHSSGQEQQCSRLLHENHYRSWLIACQIALPARVVLNERHVHHHPFRAVRR